MKTRLFSLLTVLTLILAALPAAADQVLYNNGPFDDDTDAWTINFGFVVSDTFTLASNSTLTGFNFYSWVFPGDVLLSAEVSITSDENGGTIYFDQTLSFAQSNCVTNAYGFNICLETSSTFNGPNLGPGTYWVNLQNATANTGDPVYWDENSGEGCNSPDCPSRASQNSVGTIPSESFSILGNTGTTTGSVPEPSAFLLFSSGIMAVAGLLKRRV